MTDAQFASQVQAALDRVTRLRSKAGEADGPLIQAVLTEALEEMALAFEELRVAHEELRVQNESLAEAEARAVAERDQYRDLFEFAPNGYLVTDGEGTLRQLNKAACELLHITPRYATGKPLAVFVRKEDRPEFLNWLTALQKGEPQWEKTLRLQPRALGTKPQVVHLAVVPYRDTETRKPRLRWQVRNVTGQHQTGENLRDLFDRLESQDREQAAEIDRLQRAGEAEQRRLSCLSATGGLLTATTDLDRTLRAVGQLVAGLGDWWFVELADDRGACRWHPLVLAESAQVRWLASSAPAGPAANHLPRQTVVFTDTAAPPADLSASAAAQCQVFAGLGWRSALWVPLVVDGGVIGALAIGARQHNRWSTDEIRLVEELAVRAAAALHTATLIGRLRTRERRKDEFLSELAHELRNHLAPIRNSLEIIRLSAGASGPIDRARAMIDRQTVQHARLIDDLLDVSRMALGKIRLRPEPIDLADALHAALEAVPDQFRDRGVKLTKEFSTDPVLVVADPPRLDQILTNLLANAAKYTNRGGRVFVTIAREGDWGVVRVRDTGIGIAPEVLPHVFELYTQAERSLDQSAGGLGIGLHLVKQLVELHDGSVTAHSEGVGRGSEFIVRFPLAKTAGSVGCSNRELPVQSD